MEIQTDRRKCWPGQCLVGTRLQTHHHCCRFKSKLAVVELCIWSLIDHSVIHIEDLKSSTNKGFEFSPNGKHLAVIVSDNGQDTVEIYKTKDWKLSRKLICEGLACIDALCWSPNSEIICIWCAISGLAKMIIYSTVTESYEAIFQPDDNKRTLGSKESLTSCNHFDEKLRGLELVKWMPSGQLLAISGHNETIVLLNCLTWNPTLQLRLEPIVKGGNYLSRVFKECILKESKDSNRATEKTPPSNDKHIMEEVGSRPVNIPIVKTVTYIGGDSSTLAIHTIDIMEFSACGQYLSIRHRIYPGALWVWDVRTNAVDIIILQNNISAIKWNPINPRLLIFTESTHMYEWNPDEISCSSTPRGMTVLDARWHPTSSIVALCGYNRAVIYRFDGQK
ncbi:WD repeat-containing protein WRAP73 isoform X2 [Nasonia vitripennis]|uniref:Uncharacterized protein n=1 Tax=Nasonia vitripennis TaxID=7425 RepID=A0A7M7QAH3_NASVI|nr:WD repeat-containing protein WRAP73 isoform X2 [Nasonia vitripennis]XP_031784337.1 WD repeat-containing protein WRAP73 isoform X2 [Nasonia vitripennis]